VSRIEKLPIFDGGRRGRPPSEAVLAACVVEEIKELISKKQVGRAGNSPRDGKPGTAEGQAKKNGRGEAPSSFSQTNGRKSAALRGRRMATRGKSQERADKCRRARDKQKSRRVSTFNLARIEWLRQWVT